MSLERFRAYKEKMECRKTFFVTHYRPLVAVSTLGNQKQPGQFFIALKEKGLKTLLKSKTYIYPKKNRFLILGAFLSFKRHILARELEAKNLKPKSSF